MIVIVLCTLTMASPGAKIGKELQPGEVAA